MKGKSRRKREKDLSYPAGKASESSLQLILAEYRCELLYSSYNDVIVVMVMTVIVHSWSLVILMAVIIMIIGDDGDNTELMLL